MVCPYLEYHGESDECDFETARAYCTVSGAFVEAMRADICNDRYELDHGTHCEIYRENAESECGG